MVFRTFFVALALAAAAVDAQPRDCRIFFTSIREEKTSKIFSMRADGTDVRRVLADSASDPAISSDGQLLAFVRTNQIFGMNLRTGAVKQLTAGALGNVQPAWSPDGTRIAFSSYRDGTAASSHQELYVMNADGSNPKRVTTTADGIQNFAPRWSPDGRRFVFGRAIGGVPQVFIVNADGTDARNLSGTRVSEIPSDWSPDGLRILFRAAKDRASVSDTNYQLFEMDAHGQGVRRLTNDAFLNTQARYSPDGTRIVFTSMTTGHVQVFAMNADGSHRQNLTSSPSNDNQAAWSCPGR